MNRRDCFEGVHSRDPYVRLSSIEALAAAVETPVVALSEVGRRDGLGRELAREEPRGKRHACLSFYFR